MAIDLSVWDPLDHPRDRLGRFRNKWGLSEAAKGVFRRIMQQIQGRGGPLTFRSDQHAQMYLDGEAKKAKRSAQEQASLDYYFSPTGHNGVPGWEDVNAALYADRVDTPQIRHIDGMMQPLEHDLIVSAVLSPEAFGLNDQQLDQVEEWTGKLVTDKAYIDTNLGTPYAVQSPHVQMRIIAPRGTKAVIPGGNDRTVLLDRETPLRITRVTRDANGQTYVMAVATPNGTGEPARALGKELAPNEISPAVQATPEEFKRRGLLPNGQPDPNYVPPAPPSQEDLAKRFGPNAPMPAKLRLPGAGAPAGPGGEQRARADLALKVSGAIADGKDVSASVRNAIVHVKNTDRGSLDKRGIADLDRLELDLMRAKDKQQALAALDRYTEKVGLRRIGPDPGETVPYDHNTMDAVSRAGLAGGDPVQILHAGYATGTGSDEHILHRPQVQLDPTVSPAELRKMRRERQGPLQPTPQATPAAAGPAKKAAPTLNPQYRKPPPAKKVPAPAAPAAPAKPLTAAERAAIVQKRTLPGAPSTKQGMTPAPKVQGATGVLTPSIKVRALKKGDHILVAKDANGKWVRTTKKTGATSIRVSGVAQVTDRNGNVTWQVTGTDGNGHTVSVLPVPGTNSFIRDPASRGAIPKQTGVKVNAVQIGDTIAAVGTAKLGRDLAAMKPGAVVAKIEDDPNRPGWTKFYDKDGNLIAENFHTDLVWRRAANPGAPTGPAQAAKAATPAAPAKRNAPTVRTTVQKPASLLPASIRAGDTIDDGNGKHVVVGKVSYKSGQRTFFDENGNQILSVPATTRVTRVARGVRTPTPTPAPAAPAKAVKKAAKKAAKVAPAKVAPGKVVPPKTTGTPDAGSQLPVAPTPKHLNPPTGKFQFAKDRGKNGDGWLSEKDHVWGKYGAAGALIRATDKDGKPRFLLIQRGVGIDNSGYWQLPGGALDEKENPYQGAAREIVEEIGAPEDYLKKLKPVGESVFKHPDHDWKYTTVAADAGSILDVDVHNYETSDAKWLTRDEIAKMLKDGEIHKPLAGSLLNIIDSYPAAGKHGGSVKARKIDAAAALEIPDDKLATGAHDIGQLVRREDGNLVRIRSAIKPGQKGSIRGLKEDTIVVSDSRPGGPERRYPASVIDGWAQKHMMERSDIADRNKRMRDAAKQGPKTIKVGDYIYTQEKRGGPLTEHRVAKIEHPATGQFVFRDDKGNEIAKGASTARILTHHGPEAPDDGLENLDDAKLLKLAKEYLDTDGTGNVPAGMDKWSRTHLLKELRAHHAFSPELLNEAKEGFTEIEDMIHDLGRRDPTDGQLIRRTAAIAIHRNATGPALGTKLLRMARADKSLSDEDRKTWELIAMDLGAKKPRPKWISPQGNILLDKLVQEKGVNPYDAFKKIPSTNDLQQGKLDAQTDENSYLRAWKDTVRSLRDKSKPRAQIMRDIRHQLNIIDSAIARHDYNVRNRPGYNPSNDAYAWRTYLSAKGAKKAFDAALKELPLVKTPASRRAKGKMASTQIGDVLPLDESVFADKFDFHNGGLLHRGESLGSGFKHTQQPLFGPNPPKRAGLTDKENKALDMYIYGQVASALNGSLRAGRTVHGTKAFPHPGLGGSVDLDEMRQDMDSAIRAGEVMQDSTLWRGMLLDKRDMARLVPGAVISDEGYASTASNLHGAERVLNLWLSSGKHKGQKAFWKIYVRKGQHAAAGVEMGVDELVLPRGQQFRVVRVDTSRPDGAPVYVLEAITAPEGHGALVRGHDIYSTFDFNAAPVTTSTWGGTHVDSGKLRKQIAADQGFDKLPTVLGQDEFDREIRRGAVAVYRGFKPSAMPDGTVKSTSKMTDEFKTGELWTGTSGGTAYGAGTYASSNHGDAQSYARSYFSRSGGNEKGRVMHMAIRRDARVIKYDDIIKLQRKAQGKRSRDLADQEAKELAAAGNDQDLIQKILKKYKDEKDKLGKKDQIVSDLGNFAAMLGYDVIKVGGNQGRGASGYYVILNRTAVFVRKNDEEM